MIFEIDDQKQLLAGEFWAELVRLKAGYCCEDCGMPQADRLLDAHHVDGNHENNSLANGAALCVSCHSSITMKMQWGRRKINVNDVTRVA